MTATAGPSPFNPNNGTLPAYTAIAIAPNDTTPLAAACRAIYIGAAGNVKLKTMQGVSVEFVGLQAGQILPVQAILIFNTSTTATNLVAIY